MATTVFGATVSDQASYKQGIITPTKTVSSAIKKTSGGSSNKSSSAPVLDVVPAVSTPQVSSVNSGWSNVANVLNPFASNPISLVNPFTGKVIANDVGGPVRSAVRIAEAGIAIPASILGFGALTRTAASAAVPASIASTGTQSLLKTAGIAGIAGALGGALSAFWASGGANQTANPTQSVSPSQAPTQNPTTNPNLIPSTNPTQGIGGGSIVGSPNATFIQNTYQDTYSSNVQNTTSQNYQYSTQITNPSQDTSQEAGSGTNWALIAAIGLGAYFLLGKK